MIVSSLYSFPHHLSVIHPPDAGLDLCQSSPPEIPAHPLTRRSKCFPCHLRVATEPPETSHCYILLILQNFSFALSLATDFGFLALVADFYYPRRILPKLLLPGLFLVAPISAELAPQPPVALTNNPDGSCDTAWQGVAGRTYFMQRSADLIHWSYAQVIDFGDRLHHHTFTKASPQGFFRLLLNDDTTITSLEAAQNADFDGDGLSNLFEITFGYNPYQATSTASGPDALLDPDGDGMTNATEGNRSLNPVVQDNPKLQLLVTED
jgi:hypothetical protein